MADELTKKQEAFTRAFFECGNATEAYRQAYDVSPNSRDSWIHVEACQMLDNPKITLRLKELRDLAEKHSIFTREKALEELEDARKLAVTSNNPSAAVSAITGKVKLCGYDQPSKVEISGPNGKPIESNVTIDPTKLSTQAMSELLNAATNKE